MTSTARLSLGITETAQWTGRTDREWWDVAGPVLAALFSPQRFLYASRVGEAAGSHYDGASSPESAYAFGLRTMLDGIEKLIGENRTGADGRHPVVAECRPAVRPQSPVHR